MKTSEKLDKLVNEYIEKFQKIEREKTAQLCYLECLAVECGEGECAKAIKEKFNL